MSDINPWHALIALALLAAGIIAVINGQRRRK